MCVCVCAIIFIGVSLTVQFLNFFFSSNTIPGSSFNYTVTGKVKRIFPYFYMKN